MPRSIWKGVLSFGMVAIPVKLYLATSPETKVSFHQFCTKHQNRIRNRKWCPKGDHEVTSDQLAKVYEYEKDSYVVLEDEDLEKLPLRSSRAIDIAGFVKEDELPEALYFQSAYYLEPDKAAAKPYALLKQALERSGRIAIAKFALRERERLISVRPLDGTLVMNTLHWPDEIRSSEELDLPRDVVTSPRELAMAEQLIEAMATPFEPAAFADEYREAVQSVVRAKVEGREVIAAPAPEAQTAVVDLMSVLKQSVEEAKKKQTERKAPTRAASKRAAG